MDILALLDLYKLDPRTQQTYDIINDKDAQRLYLKGLVGAIDAILCAATYLKRPKNHIYVLANKEEAAYFQNSLKNLLGKKDILFFPDSFKKPGLFDTINNSNVLLRTETLGRFINSHTTGELLVTYPEALCEQVVDTKALKKSTISIKVGEEIDIAFIFELLVEYGFEHTDFVYSPGEFSIRGDIVDIYSFGNELPYRIELFGKEVESIRVFDPSNQLSVKKVARINIVPNINSQFRSEEKVPFFKLISPRTTFWVKDMEGLVEKCKHIFNLSSNLKEQVDDEDMVEHFKFINDATLLKGLEKSSVVEIGFKKYYQQGKDIEYDIKPQPSFNKNFNLLIKDLLHHQKAGYLSFIFADNPRQVKRFNNIFEDILSESEEKITYHPITQSLHAGFLDVDLKILCYTDHQIFERYHKYNIRQAYTRKSAINFKLLRNLQAGDYVTHIDHGVGRFAGMMKLDINGQQQEVIKLLYKDNDVLYVNVSSLHKVSKYVGKDGRAVKVSKLGSDAWENLKRKTKRKIKDIAKDLIALYAKRKAAKGFAFLPDSYMQTELEASFIYEDTPDQNKATQDVKADMEKISPMDRLVCGDVGFGKTEIAIRAAFKAVADSKQVAILVPTTILALQHYNTFSKRLKDFPCSVDYINRFKSAKQKKETLKKVEEGKVDILIGTHAILSNKVKFKDLGLLIIDEEQKFGVAAKEKLRNFKVNVDTLTLTATPIPRTLQFSLLNARDLSIISTAPPNRQPVTTEHISFEDDVIREAINFEVYRGGQVYFIHNRVKDIEEMRLLIKRLCPDVDIGVAHGQLDGKVLEDRMFSFINRKYDVLLCTNIVESGLDIPNANTIIINNAHHHGLSDLHQLRGRVGRSNKKAFCYLIAPPMYLLPEDSRKRMKTITEFTDLGSGFNISMRDLDIRGAGNMLGGEQSGFIADIGYDTFHKILDEAIQELKTTDFKELFADEIDKDIKFVRDCQIDTDIEILIPDSYVNTGSERLSLYTELDNIANTDDLKVFRDKLIDRFGPIPPEVRELFDTVRLRWLAKKLGFERIIFKSGKLRCYFVLNPESSFYDTAIFKNTMQWVMKNPKKANLKESNKSLILVFDGVKKMHKARELLQLVWDGVGVKRVEVAG